MFGTLGSLPSSASQPSSRKQWVSGSATARQRLHTDVRPFPALRNGRSSSAWQRTSRVGHRRDRKCAAVSDGM